MLRITTSSYFTQHSIVSYHISDITLHYTTEQTFDNYTDMGEDVPPRYQKNLAFCRCTTSMKCDLSRHLHTKDRKNHKRFLRRTWMSLAFRQKLELLPLLPSWNWQRLRWGAVSLPAIFSRKPWKKWEISRVSLPFPWIFKGNLLFFFFSGAFEVYK